MAILVDKTTRVICQGITGKQATFYVDRAIASAPGFGGGHGPINHAHTLDAAAEDWFAADGADETAV